MVFYSNFCDAEGIDTVLCFYELCDAVRMVCYMVVFMVYFERMIFVADQEDRSYSVEQFKRGEKDVLVATDVASKGLDFPNIQHVVNYDMPEDIENYGMWLLISSILLGVTSWKTKCLVFCH